MLRLSLRSARAFGGKPFVAATLRQWPIVTWRQAGVLGARSYADDKKPTIDVPEPPVLPTSETLSSERSPPPPAATVIDAKTPEVKSVPLTPPPPPPPPPVIENAEAASKATPPPPPPQPKKKGFSQRLRSFVFTLMVLGAVGFAGGVWYSRVNDNFHDFFTEYVPFGEQAVLYLEELEFKKKYPHTVPQESRIKDVGKQVKIPAQSGASWRVADSTESSSRHSSASPSAKNPAVQQGEKKDVADKMPADPITAPAKSAEKATPQVVSEQPAPNPATSSANNFKEPEVNEPSKFPPLEPIDLMKLPDAKDPIVRDLVRMLNDLILVINADGAHGRYSTTIAKAKNEILQIGSRLKDLKSSVEKKAASEVKSAIDEFDHAATDLIQRVENTMAAQELEWRREFEQEMKSVRSNYDERIRLLMEREKKLNDEQLQNRLLEQALALKKEFVQEVKERVEKERKGRLGKLSELTSAVSDLEKLTVGWNGVLETNLKTQQLHVAVEAVRASLENSTHPKPFIRELVALKEIANGDAVVDAAIASLNPVTYQRGVSSPSQLIDRFRRVAAEVRKASLLPDDAGVASHASSWILSHVMFKKEGLADGSDVESVLTRTQTYLEEGDLDSAAREMNGLQGWAKTLSQDWIGEVRKVLEVEQALDVIATEARLQSLRVE